MNDYGFIILAAGASTRLGRPKQLLLFKGKSLIENVISSALAIGKGPVVVVIGAHETIIRSAISSLPINIEVNKFWEEGMGASIRCGMQQLLSIMPEVKAVLIMVADQPYLSEKVLSALIDKYVNTGKPIIASFYNHTAGVPVLFERSFFPQLMSLKDQEGARNIIKSHPDKLATVSFEKGSIDIDTESAYASLLKENNEE